MNTAPQNHPSTTTQLEAIKASLIVKEGQVFATSLEVAQRFNKKHKDVLKAIRNLECSPGWRGRNFAPTFRSVSGPNDSTRQEPMFELTRDGFTKLAFGFTGQQAVKFQELYIEAFNQMEAELRQQPRPQAAQLTMAIGDFPAGDRPVVVATRFGHAYVNTATYLLHNLARLRPGGSESLALASAMAARIDFDKALPAVFKIKDKMTRALLKSNPLWSDILHCQRMGLSKVAVARVCGCHPSTIKRQLKKMAEAGLFDDPLAALADTPLSLPAKEERGWL